MTSEDGVALAVVDSFGRWSGFWRLKYRSDARELGDAAGVRQETKMTDAVEAVRQCVQQKATNVASG